MKKTKAVTNGKENPFLTDTLRRIKVTLYSIHIEQLDKEIILRLIKQ